MREFLNICPVRLTAEDRASVRELIVENGLNRAFVRELALEVQAESANN